MGSSRTLLGLLVLGILVISPTHITPGSYGYVADSALEEPFTSMQMAEDQATSLTLNQLEFLWNYALFLYDRGDFAEAAVQFSQSQVLARGLDGLPYEVLAWVFLGDCSFGMQEYEEALRSYARALDMSYLPAGARTEVQALGGMGQCYEALAQHNRALESFEEALRAARESGDTSLQAWCLNNVGNCYFAMGQYSDALVTYEDALPLFQDPENSDRLNEALCLNNIADCHSTQMFMEPSIPSDEARSLTLGYYQEASQILRSMGERQILSTVLSNLGLFYSQCGQPAEAQDTYQEAVSATSISANHLLAGHLSEISSLAFNADGTVLVSGSARNGSIKLWNAKQTPLLWQVPAQRDGCSAVRFDPSGASVVSSSFDGSIRFWDPMDGRLIDGFYMDDEVHGISISLDGQLLAAASRNMVRLYDIESRLLLYELASAGYEVSFSPDGSLLACGGGDGGLNLWDARSGELIRSFELAGPVLSIAFSLDGTLIVASDRTNVQVWDVETGEPIWQLLTHDESVHTLTFSPSGATLACGTEANGISLWNTENWEMDYRIEVESFADDIRTHVASNIAFSPDGQLLSWGGRKSFWLWDFKSQGLRHTHLMTDDVFVLGIDFSPDGSRLVTGTYGVNETRGGGIQMWSVESLQPETTLEAHASGLSSIASSQLGDLLVSGSTDGDMRLWSTKTATQEGVLDVGSPVLSVAISAEGHTLMSGSEDGFLRFWNARSMTLTDSVQMLSPVQAVACSAEGERIASLTGDGGLRVIDRLFGETLDVLAIRSESDLSSFHRAQLTGDLHFSSGGHVLIWGDEEGGIHNYDVDRGLPLQVAAPQDTEFLNRLLDVHTTLEGCTFASRNGDDGIVIWDRSTREILHVLQDPSLIGVKRARFSPQGTVLASAASEGLCDGQLVVWDVEDASVLWKATMNATVDALAFSPNGMLLLTSSFDDSEATVWDVTTGVRVRSFSTDYKVFEGAFSPDGRYVLTIGFHTLELWALDTGELVDSFETYRAMTEVAFSPSGDALAVAKEYGQIDVLSTESWETIGRADAAEYWISSLAFSDDGHYLAAGGDGIEVFDVTTLEPSFVASLQPHGGAHSIAMSSDGRVLAGASSEAIAVWDLNAQRLLFSHRTEDRPTAITLSTDGCTLAVGFSTGDLQLWSVDYAHKVGGVHIYGATGRSRTGEGVSALAFSDDGKTLAAGTRSTGTIEVWDVARLLGRDVTATSDLGLFWQLHSNMATTFYALGLPELARDEWEISVEAIEAIRGKLATARFKRSLMSDKFQCYYSLVTVLVELLEQEEALMFAERSKARALVDMMETTMLLRPEVLPGTVQASVQLIQGLRDLREVDMLSSGGQIQSFATRSGSDEREARAKQEYESMLVQMEEEHLALGQTLTVNAEEMRQYFSHVISELEAQAVVLEYLVTDAETIVWVITQGGIQTASRISITRDDLAEGVREFREQIEVPPALGEEAASYLSVIEKGRDLYELLIAPVEEYLEGASHLVIIPSDVLFYLPFGALYVCSECEGNALYGGRFLIEDYSVSYAPSMASLYWPLQHTGDGIYNSVLAVGNPTGDLPAAEQEATAIASSFQQSTLLVGEAGTETAVRTALQSQNYDVLHFATHGAFDRALPLLSQLAFCEDEAEDGALYAGEILGLSLTSELVILSACQTALPPELTEETQGLVVGDELQGLSQALFVAGAPSAILTLWNINDVSTSELMQAMIQQLQRGVERGVALQQAQITKLPPLTDPDGFMYRHPYYWAPFVLYGDWR